MKQVIVARADLNMGQGKLAAQVAHASLSAYEKVDPETARTWRSGGQRKVVLRAPDGDALAKLAEEARQSGLPHALISDAGRTELEPGTRTALGIGPAPAEEIDYVTGELPLF